MELHNHNNTTNATKTLHYVTQQDVTKAKIAKHSTTQQTELAQPGSTRPDTDGRKQTLERVGIYMSLLSYQWCWYIEFRSSSQPSSLPVDQLRKPSPGLRRRFLLPAANEHPSFCMRQCPYAASIVYRLQAGRTDKHKSSKTIPCQLRVFLSFFFKS